MTETKRKPKETIEVLRLEDHLITVDKRNWILDGDSFHSSLSGALKTLSEVILKDKLKERPKEDILRIESLVELLEQHDNWFKTITKEMEKQT